MSTTRLMRVMQLAGEAVYFWMLDNQPRRRQDCAPDGPLPGRLRSALTGEAICQNPVIGIRQKTTTPF